MSPPRPSKRTQPAATSLSVRSNRLTLPPAGGERLLTWQHAFSTEAKASAPRVIQLSSDRGPFEVQIQWSSGEGLGNTLHLTVPFATQVTLLAKTLIVKLRNRCDEENRVTTTIDDGSVTSRNQVALIGAGEGEWDVPPHTKQVVAHLADYTDEDTVYLVFVDGLGEVVFRRAVGELSESTGVPVGAARKLRLEGAGETRFQLVCLLGI